MSAQSASEIWWRHQDLLSGSLSTNAGSITSELRWEGSGRTISPRLGISAAETAFRQQFHGLPTSTRPFHLILVPRMPRTPIQRHTAQSGPKHAPESNKDGDRLSRSNAETQPCPLILSPKSYIACSARSFGGRHIIRIVVPILADTRLIFANC